MTLTVHHAVRSMRRAPGLALAAVLCIGLGTAATTTVATLVTAMLLRPVPFPEASRLVRIWLEEPRVNSRISLSIPEAADFARASSFDAFLATARVRVVARLQGGAERMRGEGVSCGYFETLGIRAAAGRLLITSDHAADAAPVVVLSHGTWTRHFGGDPAVVGGELRTERATYTVVGVAQQGFAGTVEDDVVEFFIPIEKYEPQSMRTSRTARQTWVIARLKPGAAAAAAQSEADAIQRGLADAYPQPHARWRVRVEPLGESWRERLRGAGGLLFAASALLLIVAGMNVGCLLLARVLDRRRELAVRAALGADRRRLAAQLFAEALILVAAGGAVGALAGPWLLDAFLALSPVALPSYLTLGADATTVALACGILAIAGMVAGTVPALLGRSVAPGDVLRKGGRGTLGAGIAGRWGGVLVTMETALTLMLLVAGGLLVRSYERLSTTDMGFDRDRIARLAVTLSQSDVVERSRLPALYERLHRELAAVPGVARVGLVAPTLPPWDAYRSRLQLNGIELPQAPEGIEVGAHLADPGLLPMLGASILAGRNLHASDDRGEVPAAVISRSIAMLMGGPPRAIGRDCTLEGESGLPGGRFRVVGVVEDVAYDGLAEQDTRRFINYGDGADMRAARYDVYVPLARFPMPVVSIGASTNGDPQAMIEPLRRAIAQIAPASAVHWTSTMDDEVSLEYAPTRFYTILVVAFSSSALALTSIGLFALLSHAAARRKPEMGLRLALGASRASTARLLLSAGLLPLGMGVVWGVAGAAFVARAISGLLYRVGSLDFVAFAAAVTALVGVTLAAAAIPARRVARVDPVVTLRAE